MLTCRLLSTDKMSQSIGKFSFPEGKMTAAIATERSSFYIDIRAVLRSPVPVRLKYPSTERPNDRCRK
jgi:hypothetical protein